MTALDAGSPAISKKGLQGCASAQDEGVSPLFPPQLGVEHTLAVAQVQEGLKRSPLLYGLAQSRWSLASLREAIDWMACLSLSGVWRLLRRFGLSYKRGQRHVHSPDRLYDVKLARIRVALEQARQQPQRVLFFYQDEHLVARNASVARVYAQEGALAPKAELYAGFNGMQRLVGCLNPLTGQLLIQRKKSMVLAQFISYLAWVEQQCPQAQRIYIALDNWSVHVSPLVQQALQQRQSKIELLWLPTYAPWTNPIEKVWLAFNREVAHMHPHTHDWTGLSERVDAWLAALPARAEELLRLTGLAPDPHQEVVFG